MKPPETSPRVCRRPLRVQSFVVHRVVDSPRPAEVFVDSQEDVIKISVGPYGEASFVEVTLSRGSALRLAGQITRSIERDLDR